MAGAATTRAAGERPPPFSILSILADRTSSFWAAGWNLQGLPENVVQGNVDCIEAFGRLSDDGEVLTDGRRHFRLFLVAGGGQASGGQKRVAAAGRTA